MPLIVNVFDLFIGNFKYSSVIVLLFPLLTNAGLVDMVINWKFLWEFRGKLLFGKSGFVK